MTISAYHVDSVINAYNKQSKVKIRQELPLRDPLEGTPKDVVTLSQKAIDEAETYNTISNNIIDVILRNKET